MKIRYVIAFALVVSIIISFMFIIFSKEFFIVKNIIVDKDFNMNNEKFIKYLNIEPNKYIWDYNTVEIEKKLAKQIFLKEYKISKKYPDTLKVILRIRKPLARVIVGSQIMFIDKEGIIFRESEENNLPLLIYNIKENLIYGRIISQKYTKIIDILLDLKNKNSNIYNSISEINIIENKENIEYFVKYKGINTNIYLKKFINVDLLRKGFVMSLYLKERNIEAQQPYFAGLGFVY